MFGTAVRPPLEPAEAVRKLSDLGAYGVTFHDNDVFPFGAASGRTRASQAVPAGVGRDRHVGADGDDEPVLTPVFRDGGFTNNDRDVRRFAIRKVADNIDLAVELGAETFVAWGGQEGAESSGAKDVQAALDRYKEAFDVLGQYVLGQGYSIRFALEPKPNEPRGTSCCPPATRWRSSTSWSTRSWSASTRRSATRRWPASTTATAWLRRSGTASSSTSTSTGSTAPLRPGPAVRRRQRPRRVLDGGRCRARRVRRAAALRLQAAADRGHGRGVGVRAGVYAELPDPAGEVQGVPRRPRGSAGPSRRAGRPAAPADPGAGENVETLRAGGSTRRRRAGAG